MGIVSGGTERRFRKPAPINFVGTIDRLSLTWIEGHSYNLIKITEQKC